MPYHIRLVMIMQDCKDLLKMKSLKTDEIRGKELRKQLSENLVTLMKRGWKKIIQVYPHND